MRKTFLLLPLLALQLSADAQSYSFPQSGLSQHTIAALNKNISQAKTSAAHERLSAVATHTISMAGGGMELQDSTRFRYSNDRGSSFTQGLVNAFNMTEFALFDSSWTYEETGSGLGMTELSSATYNSSNKRLSLTNFANNGGSLKGETDKRYEYSSAGNISVEHELEWNNTANKWDSVSRTYYDYNTLNKLEKVTVYDADAKQWETRTTNHYNVAGNVDTVLTEKFNTNWAPSMREIHSFSGNKINKNLEQRFDAASSSWKDQRTDSFGYTAGVDFFTFMEIKEWDTVDAAWKNISQTFRALNAKQLIEEETFKNWDTTDGVWEAQAKMTWTYNANQNPIKMDMRLPAFPLPGPISSTHLYYETYFNTNVADVKKNVQMTVFPNPATDKVNISFDKASGYATVILTNVAGQLISKGQRNADSGTMEVSLQGLQPGTYHLSIQFADGSMSSQRIVKQ
ncbi:MAG: T9SS type A sorting domain-containing protein [Sphingobacteriales bacterium]|nr:MAG: T9SS type A sorting domain-containing protein [Sphingobacteriales bacterium]